MTMEETTGFLVRTIERYETDGYGIEAVIDRATGVMIGWAGLAVPHFIPEILPAVEVGWRLSGPVPGPGFGHRRGCRSPRVGIQRRGIGPRGEYL